MWQLQLARPVLGEVGWDFEGMGSYSGGWLEMNCTKKPWRPWRD